MMAMIVILIIIIIITVIIVVIFLPFVGVSEKEKNWQSYKVIILLATGLSGSL